MKKSLSIYSLCSFMLLIVGLVFKSSNWPGGIMIGYGTLFVVIALILLACHFSKNTDTPKFPLWLGTLALSVLFVGGLFKIFLWPGGSWLMIIAGCLCLIEFIILLIYIIKK